MAKLWTWFLEKAGLGPSEDERLDQAADHMRREVDLRRELAAKSVALSRSKQRELAEEVAKYGNLERAAVELQRQGRADAVQYVAVEMSETKTRIEALTGELEQLNTGAQDAVDQYRVEKDEAERLLSQHGRLKAVAQMNRDLSDLQKEMRAVAGASSAKGAYRALANQIETKTQEYRAMAQLESGDASRKTVVAEALKGVEIQNILAGIRSKALEASAEAQPTELPAIGRALNALQQDPINRVLSLPAPQEASPEAPRPAEPEDEDSGAQ